MKQLMCIMAVALSLGATLSSADEQRLSPEELVSLYYQKMSENDVTALADCMHTGEMIHVVYRMTSQVDAAGL